MTRFLICAGALTGFGAVLLGALTSHLLPQMLDARGVELAHTATDMAAWHAPAVIACALVAEKRGRLAAIAGLLLLAGVVLFCGGVLALAWNYALGPIAPVGGTLLMIGWLVLAGSAIRR